MLLAREIVAYLSRQLTSKLSGTVVEMSSPQVVGELIHNTIVEELSAEDRLNDEVREILEQYSVYM